MLKLATGPTKEPVTLAEAKMHLRIDEEESAEDDLLSGYIAAARHHAEHVLSWRTFITQIWEFWLDRWPSKDYIKVPLPPLQEPSVTAGSFATGTVYRILTVGSTDFTAIGASASTVGVIFTATGAGSGTGTATASGIIKYYGTDDTEYFMDGGDYFVDIKSEPGRIGLKYGKSWPSTNLRPHNGICLIFICGYGDSASDVPQVYRNGILLLVGHLYEHREGTTERALNSIPFGIEALICGDKAY